MSSPVLGPKWQGLAETREEHSPLAPETTFMPSKEQSLLDRAAGGHGAQEKSKASHEQTSVRTLEWMNIEVGTRGRVTTEKTPNSLLPPIHPFGSGQKYFSFKRKDFWPMTA